MDLSAALDALPSGERPRIDREAGRLVGTRCRECGAVSWPGRAVCHRCGSAALEPAPLSRRGTVVSHTRCWVPRPGLEPPFVLGQVRFAEGVAVFGHIRGLSDPLPDPPVAVTTVIAEDGAVPAFWFEADEEVADG